MSSGSLGTLNISVIAEIAGLVSDMGKAQYEADKAARHFRESWQSSIDSVKSSMEGFAAFAGIALSVEGLRVFAGSAYEGAERVNNLTQALGMSSQALQTVNYAVASTDAGMASFGGNMQQADAAMARMERSAEQAAAGTKQQAEAFRALGLSSSQLTELLQHPDELLKTLTANIAKTGDGAAKTAAIMQIFGRNAGQLTPFLNELGNNFGEMEQHAKDLGIVLSDLDQQKLAAAQQSMNEMKQAIKGASNEFALALVPAVTGANAAIAGFVSSGNARSSFAELGDLIQGAIGWFEALSTEIQVDVVEIAEKWDEATVEWTMAWEKFKKAVSGEDLLKSIKDDLSSIGGVFTNVGNAAVTGGHGYTVALGGMDDATKKLGSATGNATKTINGLRDAAKQTELGITDAYDKFRDTTAATEALDNASGKYYETLSRGDHSFAAYNAALQDIAKVSDTLIAQGKEKKTVVDAEIKEVDKLHDAYEHATLGVAHYNAAASQSQSYAKTWAADMQKLAQIQDNFSSGLSGPYLSALKQYETGMAALNKIWQDAIVQGKVNDDLIQKLADAGAGLEQQLSDTNEKIREQHDEFKKDNDQIAGLLLRMKEAPQDQAAWTAALKDYNTHLKEGTDFTAKQIADQTELKAALYSQLPSLVASKEAVAAYTQALKDSQQMIKEWQGIATNAFDSAFKAINKDILEGGSVMKDLTNIAKQVVEQVLFEFEKLAIINPLLNQIFGLSGTGGALPTSSMGSIFGGIASLFGGGSSGASAGGSGAGGLISDASGAYGLYNSAFGANTGSGFNLFSPSSWMDAGKNLWSGVTSAFAYSPAVADSPLMMMPTTDGLGLVPNYAAGGSFSTGAGSIPGYGGYGSAIGQGLGIAGGAYAAYNEYNAAGGGAAGLAGGAAYGVGTYFAGAGVAAAMSGGIAAGMAAIPVVGWVAIAAMAINAISGGKLFGTAASPTGGDMTETIGAGGATLTNILHEKGQKALFGGAYYKDVSQAIDPKAQAAADAFFAALTKGTTDFAAQFGLTMTSIVGGSFDQKYDKNGKPTTASDTVLGVTYTDTQAQFATRLQADSFLAVLDKLGVGASAFVSGVQSDADKLMAAVQDVGAATLSAQADMKHNMDLLGPGGSLGDVMAEVEKLSGGVGTLAATYKNLQAETQALQNDLALSGVNIGKTGAALVEFANAAATAAGGASQLATLIQQFDKAYYTTAEQAKASIDKLSATVTSEFAAIGEDPKESMAKFKADFLAAMPNLTPAQRVAWYQAGVDLANLTTQMGTASDNYTKFIAQFPATTTTLSAFEQSMVSLGTTLAANVAKADDLAKAAGQGGASAADLGRIMQASILQGVAAVQALETEAAKLSEGLFHNSLADQIAALQARAKTGDTMAGVMLLSLTQQQAQQTAQQQAMQQFTQASQLLGDLGQLGAVTGKGLGDFATMFGIPLDKLASILGTNSAGLNSQFKQQEDMAKAALDTSTNTKLGNEIQADILDVLQGKAMQYTIGDLNSAAGGPAIAFAAAPGPGKTGAAGATGPTAKDTANAVQDGTKPVVTATTTQTTQLAGILNAILAELRATRNERAFISPSRSTRPATPYVVMTP